MNDITNFAMMVDDDIAQLQWFASTMQWVVLALLALLVAVHLFIYNRYRRLEAMHRRTVNRELMLHSKALAELKARTEESLPVDVSTEVVGDSAKPRHSQKVKVFIIKMEILKDESIKLSVL